MLKVGEVAVATTNGATADDVLCNVFNPLSSNTKGVWFQIEGDGANYTASTCIEEADIFLYSIDGFESFASQIDVFSGVSCGDLACVALNENNNANRTCNDGAS